MFHDLIADIQRLTDSSSDPALKSKGRTFVRGLLSPGFQAIFVYRCFRFARIRQIPTQPFRYLVERYIEITTGIQIPASAEIGGGLRIHHFGGIIVHPEAKVGENCTFYHGITLGAAHEGGKAPVIGRQVTIGAGAKVLGDVSIGHCSIIGANAVVIQSFPEDSLLVGIPARRAGSASRA